MAGYLTLAHGVLAAGGAAPVQGSIDVRSTGGSWGYPDGWNDDNSVIAYYAGDAARIIWNNLIFPLAIPQGATILTAAFTPYARDTTNWDNVTINAGAEQADDIAAALSPSDYASRYDNRGATAAWTPNGIGSKSAGQAIAPGGDLAAVLQEIVNRPGFTQGDNLSLLLHGSPGAAYYYSSHGHGNADANLRPRLQVTFEALA